MKLPNGYGSVSKLSGNRRRPYIVRKTIGYKNGKPISQVIGYAATREEGLTMLADYNRDPWDLSNKIVTFHDVYDMWLEQKACNLAKTTVNSYKSAFKNHCILLYDMEYSTIKPYHMQTVINECNKSFSTKRGILNLCAQLDNLAYELELIDRKASDSVVIKDTDVHKSGIPFNEEEIDTLWENLDTQDVDIVLIYIYTGFRRNELLNMTIDNIDLENWTMVGGSKTKAGKNRVVPIHSRIRPLVEKMVHNSKNGRLLPFVGDATVHHHFKKVMNKFSMDHHIHDCRHTLRTRLDNAGANKVAIDRIMGHASSGIGESVYTHKTLDQLREAIELLK